MQLVASSRAKLAMLGGIFAGLLTGAFVGWLGSLVMRAETQNLILILVGVGAGAGAVAAGAMGANFPIDGFLTGLLAAGASMIAAALLRWRLRRAV